MPPASSRLRATAFLIRPLSHRADSTPPCQYPALSASNTTPSITPVRVMLDPAMGMASRMAITSTASVENPSMNATKAIVRMEPLPMKLTLTYHQNTLETCHLPPATFPLVYPYQSLGRFIMRIAISLVLLSTALLAADQKPKYLDKETYFQMESVTAPAISPDGTQIAFSRGWADMMKDQERANLWLVDVQGNRPRELTQGAWRDSAPAWAPDGKRIAFLSDRSGTRQIHVMWVDTHEVSQLTHLDHAPANLRWSPNGEWIAFTQAIPDETNLLPVRLPKTPKGAQLAKPAVIVDRLSWGRDGFGQTVKEYTHVFLIDSSIGGTPKQITSGNYNHADPE